ncbi:MAG: DUF4395 domain-containing protein [Actinomycetota bacterium]|nr:DUF4395 domain-containing protein [Actinomycetota bacterium]
MTIESAPRTDSVPSTTQNAAHGSSNGVEPQIDVRGPRFNAWITSLVLAVGLLLSSGWILLFQTAVFAIGAFVGLRHSPYSIAFRTLVAPRLGPVARREPQPPLRFAQLVGFVFGAVATVAYFAGAPVVGAIAAGFALAAALLNATTGFCLGCEMYLLGQRARHRFSTPIQTRRTNDVRVPEGV